MRDYFSYSFKLTSLFVLYFATAKFGLGFDAVSGFATLVWPPSGIALAFLLLFGLRFWPAIFLAAAAVNFLTGAPVVAALGIGVGNTLEPVIGAYLLSYIGFSNKLDRLKDALGFIIFAALISTTISATIGNSSLYLVGIENDTTLKSTWLAWWIGDMLGVLVITPLLLVLYTSRNSVLKSLRTIEFYILLSFLIVTSSIIFFGLLPGLKSAPLTYLVAPFTIWAVLRFGLFGVTSVIFVLSIIAIAGTTQGFGPFAQEEINKGLLYLQGFIGVLSIVFLVMSSILSEREVALEKVKELTKKEQLRRELDFVSFASHQLLTPLALIQGYLSMLSGGGYGKVDSVAKRYIDESLAGSNRMSNLIKSLLTTSRIESGVAEVNKTRFDVSKVIRNVADSLKAEAKRKNIGLEIKVRPLFVYADKEHAGEAINNLFDNAIKYTEKGSVVVSATKDGKNAVVSVKDTGVGITEKDLPFIFDKFYMSKNWTERKTNSNGLGLYITKLLITRMGGKIKVESQRGRGTVFTFTLPLQNK